MLGMNSDFTPSFVKKYLNLKSEIEKAIISYSSEVRNKEFPQVKESKLEAA